MAVETCERCEAHADMYGTALEDLEDWQKCLPCFARERGYATWEEAVSDYLAETPLTEEDLWHTGVGG